MDELEIINRIETSLSRSPLVTLGPADDCAILPSHPAIGLVTTDCLMDGTHFIVSQITARQLANKVLCVNISDILAMGGVPEYLTLSLAIPKSLNPSFVEEFLESFLSLTNTYSIAVAGGDTNFWDGPLVVSINLTGRPIKGQPIRRSGACMNDHIFVTGALGGSLAGHHLDFSPPMELVHELVRQFPITSMIDISDGLATDLRHILKQSKVGAFLIKDALPARDTIQNLSKPEQIKRILSDGEDFEICFTVNSSIAETLLKKYPQLIRIGFITDEDEVIRWSDDKSIVDERGYEHKRKSND